LSVSLPDPGLDPWHALCGHRVDPVRERTLELLCRALRDDGERHRVSVRNPAELFGFWDEL
jgi:hypothetical protein